MISLGRTKAGSAPILANPVEVGANGTPPRSAALVIGRMRRPAAPASVWCPIGSRRYYGSRIALPVHPRSGCVGTRAILHHPCRRGERAWTQLPISSATNWVMS